MFVKKRLLHQSYWMVGLALVGYYGGSQEAAGVCLMLAALFVGFAQSTADPFFEENTNIVTRLKVPINHYTQEFLSNPDFPIALDFMYNLPPDILAAFTRLVIEVRGSRDQEVLKEMHALAEKLRKKE